MAVSFKKIWNDYGVGAIIILLLVAYGVSIFAGYLGEKGATGMEYNSGMEPQYTHNEVENKPSTGVQPADPNGNEVFASADGAQTSVSGIPTSCSKPSIQNPAELLPKDNNSQWNELNPQGRGDLANVNLLKAGYHIGIDTIGQTLRNANLQIRSEPPNPQLNVGPWNASTITPDFFRAPFEIGNGQQ